MNPKLLNSIRKIINVSALKAQLIDYFSSKDIEADMLLYPPSIQDIQECMLNADDNIEVTPFMETLDPRTGLVKLGWNLFVMGTNRKFLGYTTHASLSELKNSADTKHAMESSVRHTTANDVIDFIIETLNKYDDDTSTGPIKNETPQAYASKMPVANTFYDKNKSVGKMI
jgi:hypothetical protein